VDSFGIDFPLSLDEGDQRATELAHVRILAPDAMNANIPFLCHNRSPPFLPLVTFACLQQCVTYYELQACNGQ
jgi:hypothetical protein